MCHLVKNRHGGKPDNHQVMLPKPVFHKILKFKRNGKLYIISL